MIETCYYCGKKFTVTDTAKQYVPVSSPTAKGQPPVCAYVCSDCSPKKKKRNGARDRA